MQVYTLTQEQIELAKSQAIKIKNSKIYTSYWNENSITLGLYGEIAYGLKIGKDINTEIWTDKGDSGVDFDDNADVKTISYNGPDPELKLGRLPTKPTNKKLVLAQCEQKDNNVKVSLIGEITMEHFVRKAVKRHYGEKSWYAVGPADLDVLY
tara:strand:+ start:996 stop:1454 length:459 start_codon:yes stop_codon:yes gene_type:complete